MVNEIRKGWRLVCGDIEEKKDKEKPKVTNQVKPANKL